MIKVEILPRCVFLYSALPLIIPTVLLNTVQLVRNQYILKYKKPKYYNATSPELRLLAVPNVEKYYHAAMLGAILYWFRNNAAKSFWQLEKLNIAVALLLCFDKQNKSSCYLFCIITNME